MNNFTLLNKRILVTGASSGIGYQVCKTIHQLDGRFIAIGRNKENLAKLINETSSIHQVIDVDITDTENMVSKIKSTLEFSKIDGLVHSAGIVKLLPVGFYNKELIANMMGVNLLSIINLMNFLVKEKKIAKYSSIVLVSSIAGSKGTTANGIYSATKAALQGIARSWACELAKYKIRVNTISPAMVNTRIVSLLKEEIGEEYIIEDMKKYPLGYGEVEDVAWLVVFLLSDISKWITGQNIIIDGGLSMKV